MKKSLLYLVIILSTSVYSQEHFAGLNTSSRVGILNAGLNPAELMNLKSRFETNTLGFSFNVSNNKIGFSDIVSGKNFEDLIFKGSEAVNLRFDSEVYGPSFAVKINKWAFGITTKANLKLDIVNADVHIGDAISNSGSNIIFGGVTALNTNFNQRITGTTWGEFGISVARNFYENTRHKFSGGLTLKLLFPGAYTNLGMDKFKGTITNNLGQVYMSDTNAQVNIAYSGSLANNFTSFNEYTNSVFGNLNGFVGDIGLNYQWKEKNVTSKKNKYRLNAGVSIRNIGSMTFKDANNSSTNYSLIIPTATPFDQGLNLNQFNNVTNIRDIQAKLVASGYLKEAHPSKDFKVKLPTLLSVYADVKVVSKIFVTGFIQQKLTDDGDNEQVTSQNMITVIPRFTTGYFEVFTPLSKSEISGFNGGFGMRIGGFYLGSSSIITALISDSKQADIYTGFRWGFL